MCNQINVLTHHHQHRRLRTKASLLHFVIYPSANLKVSSQSFYLLSRFFGLSFWFIFFSILGCDADDCPLIDEVNCPVDPCLNNPCIHNPEGKTVCIPCACAFCHFQCHPDSSDEDPPPFWILAFDTVTVINVHHPVVTYITCNRE